LREKLPVVYIARHGDTAWTLTGLHTGLTDLPLTAIGERHARQLGQRLKGFSSGHFIRVLAARLARSRTGVGGQAFSARHGEP
jgi:probable phosphoglycerate mutase